MNIKTEFTRPECERFRDVCNFTEEERKIFDLRVQARSLVEIQQALHMSESTVNRRIRNIKKKMEEDFIFCQSNVREMVILSLSVWKGFTNITRKEKIWRLV